MRIEVLFFIGFVVAVAFGFMMQPYLVGEPKDSNQVEFSFSGFTLTQIDTQGFKNSVTGEKALKYSELLLISNPFSVDREGNEAQAVEAKIIENDIYLDEDVIITTPEGLRLYSQQVLYNSAKEYFESFTPFEAFYGEHIFRGEKLWYQDEVITAKNINATIKADR